MVKGIAFRGVLQGLALVRGESTVDAVTQALPAELAEGVRYGTIIAASWYPIAWYRNLFNTILTTTGEGERVVREIGRAAAKSDMTGIYKTAFKLFSPQAVFGMSARLFSNYYDTGSVEIVNSRTGFAHARWSGCSGFDRNLWIEVLVSGETYLELAGAANVRSRILSGAGSGDLHMEVQAHWT